MSTFHDFKIKKQLIHALDDLGYQTPTPIQEESFSTIKAGFDFVGIAQTGTGKTFAYLIPILQELKYAEQADPRIVILAPTRELVIQIVAQIEKLTPYITVQTVGVFGGSNNLKSQTRQIMQGGVDILVGTPRRLYDLVANNVVKLKSVKKLVIDEVDIMLDFGYKTQLEHILDLLPVKYQKVLFSATMTEYVDELIDDLLVNPKKVTISLSGTPLNTINQSAYSVKNFYTKANLVQHLLENRDEYKKVLVFVDSRINADRLYETLQMESETAVIHAGKEQNNRTNTIEKFEALEARVLIATDVITRGIDFDKISHVISFNTPLYPENYMHRIGRTGRAGETGKSILLFTEKEKQGKEDIEALMNYQIPLQAFPDEVVVSNSLTPEEKDKPIKQEELSDRVVLRESGASHHEKSAKNSKVNAPKVSYQMQMKDKFKKPIRRGDKIQNTRSKKKKR